MAPGSTGAPYVTDWDEDVALILRRAKLPVILVANKVDNSAEYYQSFLPMTQADRSLPATLPMPFIA